MRAAVIFGPNRIEVAERPDPVIMEPTDAVVRVVLACACGSTSGTTAASNRTLSVRSAMSSSGSFSRSPPP
jgi:threonine dehydrogenase-like Zn-dependent dehydrogenase